MTVREIRPDGLLVCRWFDTDNKLQFGDFHSDELSPDEGDMPAGDIHDDD